MTTLTLVDCCVTLLGTAVGRWGDDDEAAKKEGNGDASGGLDMAAQLAARAQTAALRTERSKQAAVAREKRSREEWDRALDMGRVRTALAAGFAWHRVRACSLAHRVDTVGAPRLACHVIS